VKTWAACAVRAARAALFALFALLANATGGASAPAEVKIGAFVTSISEIDPAAGSFDISAYIWAISPPGVIDPLRQIQFLTRTASVEPAVSLDLASGETYTSVQVRATVDQIYDIDNFPFDHQTLRMNLETQLPSDNVRLVPDTADSRVADFLVLSGWDVLGLSFEEATVTYDTGFGHAQHPNFSRLALLIEIKRQRSALVIERFVGFAMALLITALIYLVPSDQMGVRIGMSTSAVFAAVGNRYGLDTVIGVDKYFGLVEQLTVLVFGAIFLAIAVTLLVYRIERNRTAAEARRVNLLVGGVIVAATFGLAALALVNARS
jgi:hypothetical protein